MGRQQCTACTFDRFGVKTRKGIPHTCDKNHNDMRDIQKAMIKNGNAALAKFMDKLPTTSYHDSWDMLMSVIDKIESKFNGNEFTSINVMVRKDMTMVEGQVVRREQSVEPGAGLVDIYSDYSKQYRGEDPKITKTWQAAVDFVNWYDVLVRVRSKK